MYCGLHAIDFLLSTDGLGKGVPHELQEAGCLAKQTRLKVIATPPSLSLGKCSYSRTANLLQRACDPCEDRTRYYAPCRGPVRCPHTPPALGPLEASICGTAALRSRRGRGASPPQPPCTRAADEVLAHARHAHRGRGAAPPLTLRSRRRRGMSQPQPPVASLR